MLPGRGGGPLNLSWKCMTVPQFCSPRLEYSVASMLIGATPWHYVPRLQRRGLASNGIGLSGRPSVSLAAASLEPNCALGVVIVDHGSKQEASNLMLFDFVQLYRRDWLFCTLSLHVQVPGQRLRAATQPKRSWKTDVKNSSLPVADK